MRFLLLVFTLLIFNSLYSQMPIPINLDSFLEASKKEIKSLPPTITLPKDESQIFRSRDIRKKIDSLRRSIIGIQSPRFENGWLYMKFTLDQHCTNFVLPIFIDSNDAFNILNECNLLRKSINYDSTIQYWPKTNNLNGNWKTYNNIFIKLGYLRSELNKLKRIKANDKSIVLKYTESEINEIPFLCSDIESRYCEWGINELFNYNYEIRSEKNDWEHLSFEVKKRFLTGYFDIVSQVKSAYQNDDIDWLLDQLRTQEENNRREKQIVDSVYSEFVHFLKNGLALYITKLQDSVTLQSKLIDKYTIEVEKLKRTSNQTKSDSLSKIFERLKNDSILIDKQIVQQRTLASKLYTLQQEKNAKYKEMTGVKFSCPYGDSINDCSHIRFKNDYFKALVQLRVKYQDLLKEYSLIQSELFKTRSKLFAFQNKYYSEKQYYIREMTRKELMEKRLNESIDTYEALIKDMDYSKFSMIKRIETARSYQEVVKGYEIQY